MTVVDIDSDMVTATAGRLARYGERVTVQEGDATALPFPVRGHVSRLMSIY